MGCDDSIGEQTMCNQVDNSTTLANEFPNYDSIMENDCREPFIDVVTNNSIEYVAVYLVIKMREKHPGSHLPGKVCSTKNRKSIYNFHFFLRVNFITDNEILKAHTVARS